MDSMSALIAKVTAAAVINGEIIARIEEKRAGAFVVSEWNYRIAGKLGGNHERTPSGEEAENTSKKRRLETRKGKNRKSRKTGGSTAGEEERAWTFEPVPTQASATELIDGWRYSGEPLEDVEDVFKDNIDNSVTCFDDVIRLNTQIPPVARQFRRLADNEENRADIRKFLSNLEKLQVALGEVETLMMDVADKLSEDPDLHEHLDSIFRSFRALQEKLPQGHKMGLRLSCEPLPSRLSGRGRASRFGPASSKSSPGSSSESSSWS
jgi:hypothetical protein